MKSSQGMHRTLSIIGLCLVLLAASGVLSNPIDAPLQRMGFSREGGSPTFQMSPELGDQQHHLNGPHDGFHDSVVDPPPRFPVSDPIIRTSPPPASGGVMPNGGGTGGLPESVLFYKPNHIQEQLDRPNLGQPCQLRNKTVRIERKNCETVSVNVNVCEGACSTEVRPQKRFPYLSRECRSCQPDQSTLKMITVLQKCRIKKRGPSYTRFTLPSAQHCQCSDCFSDWTLMYPAEKEKVKEGESIRPFPNYHS